MKIIKEAIKNLLLNSGYKLSKIKSIKREIGYDFGEEALDVLKKIKSHTMVSKDALITLYQQVRHCQVNSIEGSYVECGVWKGGAVGVIASAIKNYQSFPREIQYFDIFDDICEPDPLIDGDKALDDVFKYAQVKSEELSGELKPVKGIYDQFGGHGTIKILEELIIKRLKYPRELLKIHKGWFQDTIPKIEPYIGKIAILRLDGDWYSSTKVCLDYLYKHLSIGGFIIIDDYGCYEGCAKAVDEFRKINNINDFMITVNNETRYWIKSK